MTHAPSPPSPAASPPHPPATPPLNLNPTPPMPSPTCAEHNVLAYSDDNWDHGENENTVSGTRFTDLEVIDVDAKFYGPGYKLYRNYNKRLDAQPCNEDGKFLPPGAPPLPPSTKTNDNWSPYHSCLEFEMAEFLFQCCEMSAWQIDTLLDLWAASLLKYDDQPPFSDHKSRCAFQYFSSLAIFNSKELY
ncbi:hypothetical protein EDD15DRAFT_2192066 [Pisolithus albus]|nr:hypothetical protein EDD15DRAFT_2192066 [Pisolithus albus]